MTAIGPQAPSRTTTRSSYYAEAERWAQDVGGLRRSRTAAWVVAGAAVLIAFANGLALLAVQPITKPVPYLLHVDQQISDRSQAHGLLPGVLQGDPAVIQSTLARYVIAREEFDAPHIERDFRLVTRLSNRATALDYRRSLERSSGSSPLALYSPTSRLEISILSVSLLGPSEGLVRYSTLRTDLAAAQPEPWSANVTFGYTLAPMSNVERFDNPLGFQVTAYRKQPG